MLTDRELFLFETSELSGGDGGASAPAEPAATEGGGASDAGLDGGAGPDGTGGDAAPAEPPAAPPSIAELAGTDEGRQALDSWLDERLQRELAQQNLDQQTRVDGETQAERQARIKEGFALLGVEPDELTGWLRDELGLAPLEAVAAERQQQEIVNWVDGLMTELGSGEFKDLLGADLGLADLVDPDTGQPLFDQAAVLDGNRQTVLAAANAVQAQYAAAGQQIHPQQALAEGARMTRERDAQQRKIGAELYRRQLENAGNAPHDFGGGGGGTDGQIQAVDERDFMRRRFGTG